MGYTHYWNQIRNVPREDWEQIKTDVRAILNEVQHAQGIALANFEGAPRTQPEITDGEISFNGLGEDAHETFSISRMRQSLYPSARPGYNFCKTNQSPYDLAVTAVLAYLSTTTDYFSAWSDGNGSDWLEGVELVRRSVPRVANVVDIPMAVMKNDRWVPPRVRNQSPWYKFEFCVDGKAYILRTKDEQAFVFDSHLEAASWARKYEHIFWPTGRFDEARWRHIQSQQTRIFGRIFKARDLAGRAGRPPAYVRPNDFPAAPKSFYNISDLLNAASAGSVAQ